MVYVILGNGFEEIEAIAPIDILRRGGIEVRTVGISGPSIVGAHGMEIQADMEISRANYEEAEMLVLPGGGGGVESINGSKECLELIKTFAERGRLIAAICAAPTVLARLGFLKGMRAVVYPGLEPVLEGAGVLVQKDEAVVQDHNIVTARAAGSAIDFGLKLVCVLKGWYAAEKVRREIYYEANERALT